MTYKKNKNYGTGNKLLDEKIKNISKEIHNDHSENLLNEIFTTTVKLGLESSDEGDLKLVNNVLKELRYSFKIFSPYRNVKKVIIFGSARSKKTSEEYKMAEEFARKLTEKNYMIVTGGGPGVMEAGNKGALKGKEFALNIHLPFESSPNPYIDEKEKIIFFKYFFTRKLIFVKETDATALFPGGLGTMDEGFEMLTLIQTGKSKPRPIVLMEPKNSTFWKNWLKFITKDLIEKGFMNKDDLNFFRIETSTDSAIKFIEKFYNVYNSLRYIEGNTILRLNKKISQNTLDELNRDFKEILSEGKIEFSEPEKIEIKQNELLHLPRIKMKFNMYSYGKLYKLINALNESKL